MHLIIVANPVNPQTAATRLETYSGQQWCVILWLAFVHCGSGIVCLQTTENDN
jgi:predicted phosphoribosyltransferase